MRILDGLAKVGALVGAFVIASLLAIKLNGGGLWEGLAPAIAAGNPAVVDQKPAPYDLTQLKVVNEVLKTIRDRYVDPKRVKPKEMLLSALDYVQKDVAQVIVTREENNPSKVKVRVDTQEKEFRVDDVVGPWDVSSHLRDAFAFMQDGLRGTDVDLRDVEYAASNGMLHTLDPHSVLLSPDAYKEMNLSTQGQFGGLGIVISIRDQQLTVMNPMPNTPAGRVGLKKFDRIEKINGESTLNMGLNEAVNHLRGTPGSKVTVWIHRDGPEGWPNAKPFELTREVIHVASVDHKLLEGGIGYVRLKQFQANTTGDLEAALTDMKKNGELKGLVLDLRGNPGGLLDQAAKVVDTFVSDGPIVATVGNPSEGREEKVAHGEGTEPNYPLAVLVNGSSASASEIVTGALKNHERAVVIGDTTFGKGSVQLVFTDLPDKAALKLTIAQYLTEPGDVSIQGVGVTPDIELDPMTADSLEMDLTADSSGVKERDLSRALSNVRAKDGGRPMELLKYDLPIKERLADRERGGDLDENFELDFAIQFARGFVAHVQPGKRTDEVRQAKQYIADTRRAEVEKIAEELKTFAVDWGDAPADVPALAAPAAPAGVDVKVETDRPNNEVDGGGPDQPQADGHESRDGDALQALRRHQEREPALRQQAARHRQARAGEIPDGDGSRRLVRLQGPQGRLDRAASEGRAATVLRSEGRAHAVRWGEGALRGGEGTRAGRHRASRDGQVARSPHLRLFVRGHRQPPRKRRRPRPEGRGPHDVPDREERRQRAVVRDDGEPAQPVGRGRPPARRTVRSVEHGAGRHPARGLHVRRGPGARRSGGETRAVDPRRRPARRGSREGAHPDRRADDGRLEQRRCSARRRAERTSSTSRTRRGACSRACRRATRRRWSGLPTATPS